MKELPAIEATYSRLSKDLEQSLEAAMQRADREAIAWAEKQQQINNSAYFILVWGQLEAHINEVCAAAIRRRRESGDWEIRRAWDTHDPDAMRARFEDRLALVLDRSNTISDTYRRTIRFYGQRNEVAHGKNLARGIDVLTIIAECYQISSELNP